MEDSTNVFEGNLGIFCGPKFLEKLADGDLKSLAILRRLLARNRSAVSMLIAKGLKGSRIWELYETICGRDMDRFIYHIILELPCQCSGTLYMIPADYAKEIGLTRESVENHFRFRQYGEPNSFWALEEPPT